jgi:hypothetical protein
MVSYIMINTVSISNEQGDQVQEMMQVAQF